MVKTHSLMPELGQPAPDFTLPNFGSGSEFISLQDYIAQPLLVMFICNHCPYVVHIIDSLSRIANRAQEQGVACIAINSNDIQSYPQDAPDKMREFAQHYGFNFPYCFDQSQAVAQAYQATCTPDFFIYNDAHQLAYRGQFDHSRPHSDIPVTGQDLSNALAQIKAGLPIDFVQKPSMGCNIKWLDKNQ